MSAQEDTLVLDDFRRKTVSNAVMQKADGTLARLQDVLAGAASISAALSDMNLAQVRKNLKVGLPVFRPESYNGFVGDGTTDDTPAWTLLMADFNAAGGGVIELGDYATRCQRNIIKLLNNSGIRGKGAQASQLIMIGTTTTGDWFVDISGTSGSAPSQSIFLDNLTISGDSSGSPGAVGVRGYYVSYFSSICLFGNSWTTKFLDLVQIWDSRILFPHMFYCGNSEGGIGIHIRNSASAIVGAFGYGTDKSNQTLVIGAHWESGIGQAVRVEQGPGNTQSPYTIVFDFFKAESSQIVDTPLFYWGAGVSQCTLNEGYFSLNGWQSGTTAVNAIENHGSGQNKISNISIGGQVANIVAIPVLQASTGYDTLENIFYQGASAPTSSAVVSIQSGTIPPKIEGYVQGTYYTGGTSYTVASVKGVGGATKTATGSIGPFERYVRVDASAGAVTLTLPSGAFFAGEVMTITRTDYTGNAVTILPYGSEVISDLASVKLPGWHSTIQLLGDPDATNGTGPRGSTLITSIGVPVVGDGPTFTVQTRSLASPAQLNFAASATQTSTDSIQPGVGYPPWVVNPSGAHVNMGSCLPAAANDAAAAALNPPVKVGEIYQASGVVRLRLS